MFVSVCALLFPGPVANQGWSPGELLFQRSVAIYRISIAVGPDDQLHMTWDEDLDLSSYIGRDSVYYALVSEGQKGPPVRMAPGSGRIYTSRIDVGLDNTAHLVWAENEQFPENNRPHRLLYAHVAGGIPSTPDTLMSVDSAREFLTHYDVCASGSGSIYAYWTQFSPKGVRLRTRTENQWNQVTLPLPGYSERPNAAIAPNLFAGPGDSLHMVFIAAKLTRGMEEWENVGFVRYSAKAEMDSLWSEPVLSTVIPAPGITGHKLL